MANRLFKVAAFTIEAVADAFNFTNNKYMALQGGSSTQRTKIKKVSIGGMAAASAPVTMLLSRDSTIGATLTGLSTGESDAAMDPHTAALAAPVVPFTASTTKPQRSATLGLGTFGFNAYGGGAFYEARPGEEPTMYGNTASLGEISLSGYTGSSLAAVTADIEYETL